MQRRSFGLELTSTAFFAVALACIEAGTVAVYTKQTFDGKVAPGVLNLVVAFVGASGELANIVSFVWGPLSHGKPKVRFVNVLQVMVIALAAVIAFLPETPTGLLLLALVVFLARAGWSGIVTVRPTIWRANYPREARAGIVGKMSVVQVIVVSIVGIALGLALDHSQQTFRIVVLVGCVISLCAVAVYARLRVRRQAGLLRAEREDRPLAPWQAPLVVWRVLRKDRQYAQFMLWMFVLGFGNLMLMPITVIVLKERFGVEYLGGILATSVIPAVVQIFAIPVWARLLDRSHIVKFRSIHSWVFVTACAVFTLAAALGSLPLMFLASAILGVGFAGGSLAWNLGHTDFAPVSETSRYMATHVTLNGVRGMIAPFVSVLLFELVRRQGWNAGAVMYAAALAVSACGAAGFVWFRVQMGRAGRLQRAKRG